MLEVFRACKQFQIKPGKALDYLDKWDAKLHDDRSSFSEKGSEKVSNNADIEVSSNHS